MNFFKWVNREYLVTTGDSNFVEFFELDKKELVLSRQVRVNPTEITRISCIKKHGDLILFGQMSLK